MSMLNMTTEKQTRFDYDSNMLRLVVAQWNDFILLESLA